jgi:hypothetical protein
MPARLQGAKRERERERERERKREKEKEKEKERSRLAPPFSMERTRFELVTSAPPE